ncbi:MAG: outer-membrane lipoprotein carrier protein LolA, partial [Gammaproteobacteria bacterium]|nr:outer-membrane lipoprotein carrier protein LolA [Gammaproteobacteria bacterium]
MKLLLVIFSLLFAINVQAQTLQMRFSGLDSFSAEFSQKLFDADQVMQEETSGVLRVQRPNRFNLEYRQPYYQLYVADGK